MFVLRFTVRLFTNRPKEKLAIMESEDYNQQLNQELEKVNSRIQAGELEGVHEIVIDIEVIGTFMLVQNINVSFFSEA